jgi:hypothetical protein
MKSISKLLLLGMGMLIACSKETNEPIGLNPYVTMPFVASFKGYNTLSKQNATRNFPFFDRVDEVASGTGTIIGSSTFRSDFYGKNGNICPGNSYIISQLGDTLYLSFEGQTCIGSGKKESETDDHKNEICCWKIQFTIIGGTGVFEGAEGKGTTDDYLSSAGYTFYHSWNGNIIIQRINLQGIPENY